ncbi:30S ribosomal protein S16 [Parapedobacter sp. 10938]|uniref:30S ribosomal protein S16 n=1 Tax=Parapedobacter flavus TaxID=3110225 RepID=UPI002DBB8DD8|nr:30S ribosomal protein S16 [Parapedobacter sp. 10938]MEC3879404.1 30S ribosomal protein S16 [Parapedobacter sp. 10938]
MAVKIRLQRHGKKGRPFYHVIVADSRSPRDGKFIERIGSYNPNTNPATIDLNFDKALDWLDKGAQPTDTTRAILSYKGVLYKKHLLGGVKKGAFDEAAADAKFEEWLKAKGEKIQGKEESLAQTQAEVKKAALAAEAKRKAAVAAAVAAKNTPPAEEAPEAEEAAAEEAVAETAPAEETVVSEAPAAEATEAAAEEADAPEATEAATEPEAAAEEAAADEEKKAGE